MGHPLLFALTIQLMKGTSFHPPSHLNSHLSLPPKRSLLVTHASHRYQFVSCQNKEQDRKYLDTVQNYHTDHVATLYNIVCYICCYEVLNSYKSSYLLHSFLNIRDNDDEALCKLTIIFVETRVWYSPVFTLNAYS